MSYEDLKKDTRYSKLLIMQFQQEKAIKTINLYCNVISKLIEISDNLLNSFDLDKAEGRQLDLIGQKIGLERFYYQDKLISDDTYRILLKLTMTNNYQVNTDYSIQTTLKNFFGNTLILIDNRNMSFDYIFRNENEEIINILKENNYLLPVPAGVRIRLIIKGKEDNRFFGYSLNGIVPSVLGGYSLNAEETEDNGIYFNQEYII